MFQQTLLRRPLASDRVRSVRGGSSRKPPPESAEAPRIFRGPNLAPLPGHRVSFSIYDFAITLYDALVFDNSATSHAQLELLQQRVLSIAGEELRLSLAADIKRDSMQLPCGRLRQAT